MDSDRDGFASTKNKGVDCNNYNKLINPDMPDTYGDGIDNNCDGVDVIDDDDNGYASIESAGKDCDDSDPSVFPADCFNKCIGYTSACGDICQDGCLQGFKCIDNSCINNLCPETSHTQTGAIYPIIGYCPAVPMVSPYRRPDRLKLIATLNLSSSKSPFQ